MSLAEKALASDRRMQRSRGLQANRAFVVESLLLLLFLAFALALILRVFASSDTMAHRAHAQTTALHLATNAAEVFAADPLQTTKTQYFDEAGKSVAEGSSDAAFQVDLNVDDQAGEAGTLYNATITVAPVAGRANIEPYTLETSRYVSNARIAALAAYQSMQQNSSSIQPGQNAVSAEELANSSDMASSEIDDANSEGQAGTAADDEVLFEGELGEVIIDDGGNAGEALGGQEA